MTEQQWQELQSKQAQWDILVDNPPAIDSKVNVPPEIRHLTITIIERS